MSSDIERELQSDHFHVVIFGSARIQKGDKIYEQVYDLAKRVGEEGMDVVTGGGPGLMDAAMNGHFEGKGGQDTHEIGLQIKLPKEQHDSAHFDIKEEFAKFSNRLDTFMDLANVCVIAPGGIGSCLELFYAWQLMQVNHIEKKPIILLGDMWFDLKEWVRRWPLKHGNMDPEDLDFIHSAKTNDDAMEIIKREFAGFKGVNRG